MNFLEALMIICFGVAWPTSIYKSYTSKQNKGKSLYFLYVILLGYTFGILNKILNGIDFVIIFYILNFVMVFIDILLYYRNLKYDE